MRATGPALRILASLLCLATLLAVESSDPSAQIAELRGKPFIIRCTADWCGWCKREMSDLAANHAAMEEWNQATVVVIDVDRHRSLAERLSATSLPTLIFIDANGMIVEELVGYHAPIDIAAAALRLRTGAERPGRPASLWEDAGWDTANDDDLIANLGLGDTQRRLAVRRALCARSDVRDPGHPAHARVWVALSHPALGVRIDAAVVLATWTKPCADYDPFASVDERQRGVALWQMREQGLEREREQAPTQPVIVP